MNEVKHRGAMEPLGTIVTTARCFTSFSMTMNHSETASIIIVVAI